MARMTALMDSLSVPVLSAGDFNDDVWHTGGPGTIKYNGAWEKIDGHFARGLTVRERVFAAPVLSEEDRTWGGTKPRRTFSGPRYLGGVSDHYPVILWIRKTAAGHSSNGTTGGNIMLF